MLYGKMCGDFTALLRKSTIALTLAIALSATSCKTQKTASVQTSSLTRYDSTLTVKADSAGASLAVGHTVSNEDIEQTTETVEWSEPDTAGRQHPVRTTRNRTVVRRFVKTDTANATSAVSSNTVSRAASGQTAESAAVQAESKTRTTRHLWLVWLLLGVAVAMVVKRIFKHYGK